MTFSADRLERLGASPRRRLLGGRRTASGIERVVAVALLLVLWELASRLGVLDERTLGAPSATFPTGWDLIRDGSLPRALLVSTRRVGSGLALGVVIGATLAALAGLTRVGDALIDANVQTLRYVPIIAVQPLLIVWFGIGEVAKVMLVALGVAFPVYVNTASAIRAIQRQYHELADVLRLTTWQRLRRVVIPGATGGFLVGVRYASAVAWLLVIVAEQTNADEGLGQLMFRAQTFLKTDMIVLCVVVYAGLGVASDLAIRSLERWASRWQAR